ncbi:cytochrome bd-I oxidase subunit CydX [Thauera butanivorans]|jgi:cyd operon protein YbgT|nr:cytochrome bd-I oxidase subunit CydX [Thauera butanivorans]
MWYFAWMLGIGFAVLLAILNVLWMENEDGRRNSLQTQRGGDDA